MDNFKSPNGYVSCIKVAGISVLPPLITEESRKELKNDREKAVEIEKKLKRKRASIDSGVMTGSYIESNKNCDLIDNTVSYDISDSDIVSLQSIENNLNFLIPDADGNSSDKFLKSALEDSEFRDFFYSTADRIFKDNNIENISKQFGSNGYSILENFRPNTNYVMCMENNGLDTETILRIPNIVKPSDVLQFTICTQDDDSSSNYNLTPKAEESLDSTKVEFEDQVSLPERSLVRRNSYTLESPSPILLEHIAKEKANKSQVKGNWTSFSDKKLPEKSLGFKRFTSARKPRKTWHKRDDTKSKPSLSLTPKDLYSCRRSRTFVKTNSRIGEINISLPSSSRTSPIHLSSFSQSSDCIQSISEKENNFIQSFNLNSSLHPETSADPIEIGLNQNPFLHDNLKMIFEGKKAETDASYIHCGNILNNNCGSENLVPSQKQSSPINLVPPKQSGCFISKPTSTYVNSDKDSHNYSIQTTDLDDIVSVCSSLSLSKFVLVDDNTSRPSTQVDLSKMFSELQLHHERQIQELLEKQHRETAMLTKLHVTNELSSSRSTTNMSNTSELPFENCISSNILEEAKTSCSRELFPNKDVLVSQSLPTKEPADQKYYSKREKDAALKLTSCVRGYLTRRLLKTEKVQQLIDTIKESLNCAFSLQSESHLRKIDLDLHERLAHQLGAALYELQTIISSPVAIRMGIIATDREKLQKPLSRPSSAISSATQKSILRRQQSLNNGEKRSKDRRTRSKSLCLNGQQAITGMNGSTYSDKSDSSITGTGSSSSSSRKPWR